MLRIYSIDNQLNCETGGNHMINLVIAEEKRSLRDSLKDMLDTEIEFNILATTSFPENLIKHCYIHHPHIVLLSSNMLEAQGFLFLQSLYKTSPETKIILLFEETHSNLMVDALHYHVQGYLPATSSLPQLRQTILAVHEGLCVMHEKMTTKMNHLLHQAQTKINEQAANPEILCAYYNMDEIDQQIIRLVVEGKSNKQIAMLLNYSEGSIKNRISKILSSTRLRDRTQIAVFALQNHLVAHTANS